jgi:hypothetical protein
MKIRISVTPVYRISGRILLNVSKEPSLSIASSIKNPKIHVRPVPEINTWKITNVKML